MVEMIIDQIKQGQFERTKVDFEDVDIAFATMKLLFRGNDIESISISMKKEVKPNE